MTCRQQSRESFKSLPRKASAAPCNAMTAILCHWTGISPVYFLHTSLTSKLFLLKGPLTSVIFLELVFLADKSTDVALCGGLFSCRQRFFEGEALLQREGLSLWAASFLRVSRSMISNCFLQTTPFLKGLPSLFLHVHCMVAHSRHGLLSMLFTHLGDSGGWGSTFLGTIFLRGSLSLPPKLSMQVARCRRVRYLCLSKAFRTLETVQLSLEPLAFVAMCFFFTGIKFIKDVPE